MKTIPNFKVRFVPIKRRKQKAKFKKAWDKYCRYTNRMMQSSNDKIRRLSL